MEQDPLLQPLPQSLTEGLNTSAATRVAQDLLNATSLSEDRKQEQLQSKIDHKSLLLHPTTASDAVVKDSRAIKREKEMARRERKKRPRPLSARERRKAGFDTIPLASRDPALFQAMHQLWQAYMAEILAGGGHEAKLLKADYHGAKVTVVQSACPSHVFSTGIVVKETRNTFVIGTSTGKLLTIPKRATVFEFETQLPPSPGQTANAAEPAKPREEQPNLVKWQVFGEHFGYRAAERVSKKFKGRSTIEF